MRGMEEKQIAPRTALSTPTLILRQVQARITANPNELDELKKRDASTATLRYNSRAACVEMAISGDYTSCEQIAKALGRPAEWVCKWLKRFIKKGISGLWNDAPRSGRPTTCNTLFAMVVDRLLCFQPQALVKIGFIKDKKLIEECQDRSRWTRAMLAHYLGVAPSTVGEYVKRSGIKYFDDDNKEYCYSEDPYFFGKVLQIELLRRHGESLGYEICSFDEKPCIQATSRDMFLDAAGVLHPSDRFERNGSTTLLAILRPNKGNVFWECTHNKTGETITAFVRRFLQTCADPNRKIALLMDNLSSHKAIAQLTEEFPNLVIVFTPTNSSWMNPVEGFFGILTKGVLKGGNFSNVDDLESAISGFCRTYNETGTPYQWRFDVQRKINQLLCTIDNLKLSIPNAEYLLNKAKEIYSAEAVAACKLADRMARTELLTSFGDLEVLSPDVVKTISGQFEPKQHPLERFHMTPALQRAESHLDELDYEVLSPIIIEALEDPLQAQAVLLYFEQVLPKEPYNKKPQPKFTQAELDKREAEVTQRKKELTKLKADMMYWLKQQDALNKEQIVLDRISGAPMTSKEVRIALNKAKNKANRAEAMVLKKVKATDEFKREYDAQLKASQTMLDNMNLHMLDGLRKTVSLWEKWRTHSKIKSLINLTKCFRKNLARLIKLKQSER